MLQATHHIRKVALSHADIRTTEVYLRMEPSEKLEAFEVVVPPELRRGRFKAPDALSRNWQLSTPSRPLTDEPDKSETRRSNTRSLSKKVVA